MTIRTKRKTLIAGSLAFGLLVALQLPVASAQSEHEGHHPDQAPARQDAKPGTGEAHKEQRPQQMQMDHGDMDHDRMMQQMHEQHMGNGPMNHGSEAPEKHSRPAAKERKDAE